MSCLLLGIKTLDDVLHFRTHMRDGTRSASLAVYARARNRPPRTRRPFTRDLHVCLRNGCFCTSAPPRLLQQGCKLRFTMKFAVALRVEAVQGRLVSPSERREPCDEADVIHRQVGVEARRVHARPEASSRHAEVHVRSRGRHAMMSDLYPSMHASKEVDAHVTYRLYVSPNF